MFVWDTRNHRVLVSPWLVEHEVAGEIRRLHSFAPTLVLSVALGGAGGILAWVALRDVRLRVIVLLVWLVVANRLAHLGWELNTRRAIRRWRSSFRSRVRRFGLEHAKEGEDPPDLIRVVCTHARYTRVAADGSLTNQVDSKPSWGYWVPGLGYLGWGLGTVEEAQEAALKRIADQLTGRPDDQSQPPVAADIREQTEIWFAVQFRPTSPNGTS